MALENSGLRTVQCMEGEDKGEGKRLYGEACLLCVQPLVQWDNEASRRWWARR